MNDLIESFAEFRRLGADGRQWTEWAALFAEDAVYIEHCMGRFEGRQAITAWITNAMDPVACMTFSVEWVIVDGDRIAFWIWNHLPDPSGSGRPWDFGNLSILTYRSGSLVGEEDFYSALDSERTVVGWYKAGGTPSLPAEPQLVPHAPAHPPMAVESVRREELEALANRIISDDWRDLVTSYAAFHDHGGSSLDEWAASRRIETYRVVGASRIVVVFEHHLRNGRVQPASVIADLGSDGRATMFDHCYNPRESERP